MPSATTPVGWFRRISHDVYRRRIRPRLDPMQQQRLKLVVWHAWGYRVLLSSRNLGAGQKATLLRRFLAVDWKVPHAHKPVEISHVVDAIFEPGPGGAVIEAGCWNGGSTAKLSLACAMTGAHLHVYDSFEGVEPGPSPSHFSGAYAATLDDVRATVRRFGSVDACTFHPGWFCDTLRSGSAPPRVKTVYIDCDLAKGTAEVLAGVVPALATGARVFTQDFHIEAVRRYLEDDRSWAELGVHRPEVTYLGENTAGFRFSSPSAGHEVRPLTTADVDAMSVVHGRAFSRSALTRLGPDLVGRYYSWLLTGPHDVAAFGAFDGPRLVGFVVAGRFRRATSGFVNRNRGRLALRIATRPWLLANPLVRERTRRAWRWGFRRNLPPVATPPAARATFGVLAVAVDPVARRTGVGRALLSAVEGAAADRGLRHLHLTVEPDNAGAVVFYERLGWTRSHESGRWLGAMDKELKPIDRTRPAPGI